MLADQKIRVFVKLLAHSAESSSLEEEKAMKDTTSGKDRSAEYFVTMLDRARNQNQPQSFL